MNRAHEHRLGGWLRLLIGVALLTAWVWVVFTWVFPWIDRTFVNDPTFGAHTIGLG